MALLAVREGRGGEHIDISMHDAAMAVRGGATAAALAASASPEDFRPEVGLALCETYRTSDGRWLCLGAREPRSIQALLERLDLQDLIPIALGPPGAAQAAVRGP